MLLQLMTRQENQNGKDTFKPIKLPKKLTIIAIITTALSERASIIAQTDGIIKYEKTGITPLIFTAKTIDKPIDI